VIRDDFEKRLCDIHEAEAAFSVHMSTVCANQSPILRGYAVLLAHLAKNASHLQSSGLTLDRSVVTLTIRGHRPGMILALVVIRSANVHVRGEYPYDDFPIVIFVHVPLQDRRQQGCIVESRRRGGHPYEFYE
jgi:hypothetical protein